MKKKKCQEHKIQTVYEGSIGEEMEIEAGDILLKINDTEIEDVFDYRYLIKDEYIEVLIRKPSGEEWLLEIDKDEDEDLGLEFENGLMSEYRSCANKCIFCFIDQMPPNMRETLYFKDDDSRLSFLQGNYITLTNMSEKDVDRIIHMHLSPINISIQTMNPELRCKMLNNRFAGEQLKLLKRLYDGHVEMNGQIVLCKGVNDGEELKRSIEELGAYLPFMRSVSVVPAGMTKFREGLFPLETFSEKEAAAVIDMIESYQPKFYQEYGLHFIHASDEWYITAKRELPEEERYDGYIQLENGVGMLRLFTDEFEETLQELKQRENYEELRKTVTCNACIATGKLAYPTLYDASVRLKELLPGVHLRVVAIRNDFFGETITVSGLVTGRDLIAQIKTTLTSQEECKILFIPSNMLRSQEEVFLDDVTVQEVEEALGLQVTALEANGSELIAAVLGESSGIDRDNGQIGYIDAFGRNEN